ncbi:MAG: nucleoside monophosphate kinase, partial [Conexivisphaerales archaeon]
LGITGMPGAGKTTVANYISSRGIKSLAMGDIIREKAKEMGYGAGKEGQKMVVRELREIGGKDIVAKLTLEKMVKMDLEKVIIDGIRSMHEVELFSSHFKVILLAVHASQVRRYEFLSKRGRTDDPHKIEDFKERDKLEIELGIGNVIALSDLMLVNEDISLSELRVQTEKLIKKHNIFSNI